MGILPRRADVWVRFDPVQKGPLESEKSPETLSPGPVLGPGEEEVQAPAAYAAPQPRSALLVSTHNANMCDVRYRT